MGRSGAEGGDFGDVHSLLGLGHGAAEDDVVDLGFVELRDACERTVDGDGGEVVGARVAEGSAGGLAYGSSDGGGDDGFIHCDLTFFLSGSFNPAPASEELDVTAGAFLNVAYPTCTKSARAMPHNRRNVLRFPSR